MACSLERRQPWRVVPRGAEGHLLGTPSLGTVAADRLASAAAALSEAFDGPRRRPTSAPACAPRRQYVACASASSATRAVGVADVAAGAILADATRVPGAASPANSACVMCAEVFPNAPGDNGAVGRETKSSMLLDVLHGLEVQSGLRPELAPRWRAQARTLARETPTPLLEPALPSALGPLVDITHAEEEARESDGRPVLSPVPPRNASLHLGCGANDSRYNAGAASFAEPGVCYVRRMTRVAAQGRLERLRPRAFSSATAEFLSILPADYFERYDEAADKEQVTARSGTSAHGDLSLEQREALLAAALEPPTTFCEVDIAGIMEEVDKFRRQEAGAYRSPALRTTAAPLAAPPQAPPALRRRSAARPSTARSRRRSSPSTPGQKLLQPVWMQLARRKSRSRRTADG